MYFNLLLYDHIINGSIDHSYKKERKLINYKGIFEIYILRKIDKEHPDEEYPIKLILRTDESFINNS